MDDKIEINLIYSRAEILKWAQEIKDIGGDLHKTREVLTQFYPAWHQDTRTSLTVELMFRDKGDMFYEFMTRKLAELDT